MGHTIFKIQDKFLDQISNTGCQWLCKFGWGAEKDGRQSVTGKAVPGRGGLLV